MDRILTATLLLVALPPVVSGQIPPGYFVETITEPLPRARPPRLNDSQIVFERWSGPNETGELFLYDRDSETLTQLTDDAVVDAFPDIAEDGTITWTRFIGPPGQFGPTGEIMIRDPDGTVTRLTDNAVEDRVSRINSQRHVAWKRYTGPGCGGAAMDIYFFDGQTIRAITTDGVPANVANQLASLNDLDQIVFTKFDFCVNPWESEIWMWENGRTSRLTTNQIAPSWPSINNRGLIAWFTRPAGGHTIEIWENGVTRELTDWGTAPILNDEGQVAFHRWHNATGNWQQWLYSDGSFWQLTDEPFWSHSGHINEVGEVAWLWGAPGADGVRYMRRFDLGDLNCDRHIDTLDIEPFIIALFDSKAYSSRYPTCDPLLGDVNNDGVVNAFDIEPFISLLFP